MSNILTFVEDHHAALIAAAPTQAERRFTGDGSRFQVSVPVHRFEDNTLLKLMVFLRDESPKGFKLYFRMYREDEHGKPMDNTLLRFGPFAETLADMQGMLDHWRMDTDLAHEPIAHLMLYYAEKLHWDLQGHLIFSTQFEPLNRP